MKRVWPIIAVSDVRASARWYTTLLGARRTHPGGAVFDQIADEDGAVLLCLHHWGPSGATGDHVWPTLLEPGPSDPNGLLLWFVVDDLERAWERARAMGAAIEEEPNTDNGTGKPAFVLRDPDGYHVAVNEAWAEGAG
ncbi:MAG: VOC family protein [Thermoanaerobaculia bacterium]|nr:VOC family protein [Thermoanaerobaculia bacterium]